jgi:hypothetical protein
VRPSYALAIVALIGATLAVTGASSALVPNRILLTGLPVRDLALTGHSVAFVTDANPDELRCARIGLWNTRTSRRYVFDAKEQCLELTSTGQGVWDVAVATKRLLWITYGGGNIREWTLWTATTTRTRPRQLRFVARDVDARAPIVIGPGTAKGVPYAVDRQIVYLGDDGKAIFRTTVASPVRAIAAGYGGRLRVAALLTNGRVVGLDEAGDEYTSEAFPVDAVTAIRVTGRGTAVQVGRDVEIVPPRAHDGPTVTIPVGASMVDVAQGRILWSRDGDLGTTTIATGESVRLNDGGPKRPYSGQLESRGYVWACCKLVRWRGGRLP